MIFLVLLTLAVVLGYYFNQYLHSYWARRGFKQLNPKFFVGDGASLLALNKSSGEFFYDIYKKYKDLKIVGVYLTYLPILVVTDPKIVQDIMIRDFNSFHDRPMAVDTKKDPLSGHLFSVQGQYWRDLRVKLSPTFTSGKLKGMFPIIRDCGGVLQKYLLSNVKNGVDVFEFRDLMARYNTNIISSTAFGIDNDCINDPDHIFRKMGASFFDPTFINGFRNMVQFISPNHFHKVPGLKIVSNDLEKFMLSIVQQTVEHRDKTNFSRKDFLQMLIQLKNQGYVSVDKSEKDSGELEEQSKSESSKRIDMRQLAAQVFLFFVAGFETSSSTMSFCLFELARSPNLQKKAQAEIDKALKSNNQEVSYDSLAEMKYVDCCIDETLRKYPIIPVNFRTAARDYKVAGTDLIIPQGTAVYVPLLGFHRDPAIYESPMEFRPERFTNSSTGGGVSEGIFYTPFGDGPRNCIGMRMGKLTTKMGLVTVLSKFNLELSDKKWLHKELEFNPTQVVLTPITNFDIKITPR